MRAAARTSSPWMNPGALRRFQVIAAHELTHHADFFHDEFEEIDQTNMWFEEGMCFYIPRTRIFSPEKFSAIMGVENKLIDAYKGEYGGYTLDNFGSSGYRSGKNNGYAAALYDYWRSTKIIRVLVENFFHGDVVSLIDCYKGWANNYHTTPLHHFFNESLNISNFETRNMWFRS
ncbi:MAG: hypothetical protein ACYCYO_14070 [Bacilli bacterium]